jgi:hypothetical protein
MKREETSMGIELIIAAGVAGYGYFKSRRFVRERLRFVDAVQRPATPIAVGVATGLATGVLVAVVPFIGGLAIPVLTGVGIGVGVSHGAKDSKRLPPA